ncbi:MAG TPA: HIT domain-containing protein [Parachlamydiaceae bacterium]|nr:HIT domain-containing protein [Parachlamydiaceae bacterium]
MKIVKSFDPEDPSIKDRTVTRNHLAFSFLTHMPIVPGHLLICPIRVVESCEELTNEEWKAIFDLQRQVCQALKKTFDSEGFNFAWNMGENAGQSVPHYHLHVVPRKKGDAGILEYEPRVFLYRPRSRAISELEELSEVTQMVKGNL